MAFTKAYAKILANMLDAKTLDAFRVVCGKVDHIGEIPMEVLDELQALELIKPVKIDDKGRGLALLTQRGKKVSEFV